EPVVLHMTRYPMSPGKPRKEQHRMGRADLLSTTFETFERKIRDQLARNLGDGGFEPARDIIAIAVNRWPHGYAYTYNPLYDPMEWVYTSTDDRPCVKARQPFGLITIANADAAASPHTDAAMLEAHRAVQEAGFRPARHEARVRGDDPRRRHVLRRHVLLRGCDRAGDGRRRHAGALRANGAPLSHARCHELRGVARARARFHRAVARPSA